MALARLKMTIGLMLNEFWVRPGDVIELDEKQATRFARNGWGELEPVVKAKPAPEPEPAPTSAPEPEPALAEVATPEPEPVPAPEPVPGKATGAGAKKAAKK